MTVPPREFSPREYQKIAVRFLTDNPRCALYAGMGLGKTVSVLTAIAALRLTGEETRPALVVAPLRVARSVWPEEARKWAHLAHLRVVPVTGSAAKRTAALQDGKAEVYTINYDNLPWLVSRVGQDWPFGALVADEATLLKGLRMRGKGTSRARALAAVAHTGCTRFIELSGTPTANGLKDLWGQWWFIDGGRRLGRSFSAFSRRWFRPGRDGYSIEPVPYAHDQITGAIKDLSLSINARDYFNIRDPIIRDVPVELPGNAMRQYRKLERQLFLELDASRCVTAVNAAAKTMKCLQFANGAVYLDPETEGDDCAKAKDWQEVHRAKIDALREIVEEAAGAPVLVAYHFKSDLVRLMASFPEGRKLDNAPATLEAWNVGKIPILFAHPKSAGHGLNLQDGGNIIVFFGHDWNLELYMQILERIGPVRQFQAGHDRPVFVYNIIARGTLDETVIASRENKRGVQDLVLDTLTRRGADA